MSRLGATASILLFVAAIFAGCTTDTKPFQNVSTIAFFERLAQLDYPEPIVTDASGEVIEGATVNETTPKHAQRLVNWEGSNPWLAVTNKGTVFMTGFEKVHKASPPWQNWTLGHLFERPGIPNQQDRYYSLEVAVHADAPSQRIFVYHYNLGVPDPSPDFMVCQTLGIPCWYGACPSLYYSTDEGVTWHETALPADAPGQSTNPESCASPISSVGFGSHPKITTGTPRGGTVPPVGPNNPATAFDRALYICDVVYYPRAGQQVGGFGATVTPPPVPKCSTSYDSGATWEENQIVANDPNDLLGSCLIANIGRPAVHTDGTVYLPLFKYDFSRKNLCRPSVAITQDDGQTWVVRDAPEGPHRVSADIEPGLALSPDGKTAYYAYRDVERHAVYYLRSTDMFQTWQGPFRVSPASHQLDAGVTITAGSAGRLAFGYYGTSDQQDRDLEPPRPATAHKDTVWFPFVTTTFNADAEAPTFVTDQASTRQDTVQVGCMWDQFLGWSHAIIGDRFYCRNIENMIMITTDADGRILFALTDGCVPRNDCVTDFSSGFQARDRMLSLVIEASGESLFAEKGILPDLGIEPPAPLAKHQG